MTFLVVLLMWLAASIPLSLLLGRTIGGRPAGVRMATPARRSRASHHGLIGG